MTNTRSIDPRVEAQGQRIRRDVRLEVIADRAFVGEDVWLDGRWFVRCSFTRCKFRIALGWFTLESSTVADCTFVLHGFAEATRNFVDAAGSGSHEH